MPAGFRNAAGVDFDDVFDPYVEGTKPANCGLRTSDGFDLVNRYAPISYGSKAPDVGFRTSGGVDVSNLWAAKGTAVYQGINEAIPTAMLVSLGAFGPAPPDREWDYSLGMDGVGSYVPAITVQQPFDWTTDGEPPLIGYEVQLIDVVQSGDAVWQFFNDAPAWVTLNSTTSRTVARLKYNSTTLDAEKVISVTARLQIREAISGIVRFDEVITFDGQTGTVE